MGQKSRAKRERRKQKELEATQRSASSSERTEVERPPPGVTLDANEIRRLLEARLEEEWGDSLGDPDSVEVLAIPGFRVWASACWYELGEGVEGSFWGEPPGGEEEFYSQSWMWTVEVYDTEYDSWEPVNVYVDGRHERKPEIPQGVVDHLVEDDFEIPRGRSGPELAL